MIRSSKCGIYMMVCSPLVLQMDLVSDIQVNEAKPIREFKHTHTSHIFDVQFDLGRIVRYVSYHGVIECYVNLLYYSASHDQKICVLDFTAGLDVSVFV